MSLWDALRMNMMISYQELVRTFLSWFLTKESRMIRLLAALLIGATWPFSFPMALLVSLF
nr:GhoT/OrtT family toxin [Klebsiella pneumoniae]